VLALDAHRTGRRYSKQTALDVLAHDAAHAREVLTLGAGLRVDLDANHFV
jgi:hypothetical protein